MYPILERLKEQIVIFDGAMGTSIQQYSLKPEDYQNIECNEWLNIVNPKIIQDIHERFLKAGAQVIETNTFSANMLVLSDYGLHEHTYNINLQAVLIAKKAISNLQLDASCFISGSIGPGSKLPSLGHCSFTDLQEAYIPQIQGLLDGGVDLLQIETCQDFLQIKAALFAAETVFIQKNKRVPLMVSVTMQDNGQMLLGSDLQTVIHTFGDIDIDILGINCGLGPQSIEDYVSILSALSPKYVSLLPNAGLPVVQDGKLTYDLKPEEFANLLVSFAEKYSVHIMGGCCGTTPDFIQALANRAKGMKPNPRSFNYVPALTSLFCYQTLRTEPKPFLIGEKTNTNGSKQFRTLLQENQWEAMLDMANEQQKSGAHAIDVCVATLGRDEKQDMSTFVSMLNQSVTCPLVVDTTSQEVVECALQNYGGKVLINSVNLEEGDEKALLYMTMAKRYGAALIALTIDEEGMAKTTDHKMLLVDRFVNCANTTMFPLSNLYIDCLTFSLATGEPSLYNAGIESLNAIKMIKEKYPLINTSMGVSNISFGLKPSVRKLLNSVFLQECVINGLDAAIIDAAKIVPINNMTEEEIKWCKDLIYNRRTNDYDPLNCLLQYKAKIEENEASSEALPPEKALANKILKGSATELTELIHSLLSEKTPLAIINDILVPNMYVVGNLFEQGKTQLPFVLKSAEVMKKCVTILEPYIETEKEDSRMSMLLATVQGDVHDIGKNLVEIILSNNGFKIYDLGVKQTPQQILQGVKAHNPNSIGLSALLIKSTYAIKDTLQLLASANVAIPVICGGAALNETFVKQELQPVYKGPVRYAKDAMSGLSFMQDLPQLLQEDILITNNKPLTESHSVNERHLVPMDNPIPKAPFIGHKIVTAISIKDFLPYLNTRFLYYSQWKYTPEQISKNSTLRKELEDKIAYFHSLANEHFEPSYSYGYFQCQSKDDLLMVTVPNSLPNQCNHCDTNTIHTLYCKRQLTEPYNCVSDYIRKSDSFSKDLLAIQVVTIGKKPLDYANQLKADSAFQDYFLWYGYCAAMTEALAAWVHAKIRKELSINQKESGTPEDDFKNKYQGARYSFGYSALPDMNQQQSVLQWLHANEIGITMNESEQLEPELSTCALIIHHPMAIYW